MSTENNNTSSPPPPPSSDAIDPAPLLLSGDENEGSNGNGGGEQRRSSSVRRPGLREAARLLSRASSGGGRAMREPSMVVREAAAEQLEERQSDWAYSKPIVVLDIVWNLAFVSVAGAVLVMARNEHPMMPLRVWLLGYALQCVLHMVCVLVEYRRRNRVRNNRTPRSRSSSSSSSSSMEEDALGSHEEVLSLGQIENERSSVAKHLESANTMFSFIWWIIGFYWVSAGGQELAQESPRIYWLSVVFLGFDVFFVVFCVALACVIGIAVCCCLPCIIAVLYAVADQEGASKEDIEQLTKFKFRKVGGDVNKHAGDEAQGNAEGVMTECGTDSPVEHTILQEDAECCICLCAYEDGSELRELPCGHHFHCSCVDKWLYINATCPLCKYDILKSSNLDREEV
ncbi:E3 ubiquitin-protein ligase At1g12760 [Brassica napus]|uniref:E3 ubiquitin-protein ligase At1g12760 n=1 Tax=Brassica napus TaxID=3708 RepID=UPI002078B4DC|nr:E3 ubiquitin-protein ligase At1g12760 [Brassica napus]